MKKAKEAEPERLGRLGLGGLAQAGCVSLPLQTNSSPPFRASHQVGLCFLECPALLLLLSLLLLPLGLPVLGAPPRLICDNRVLERYILEAREAENVTVRSPPPPGPQDIPQDSLSGAWGSPPGSRNLAIGSGLEVGSQSPTKNDKTGNP